jgi:Alr-MurF fusion protein
MIYSITQIAAILNGVLLNATCVEAEIAHILLDSRRVMFPKNSLFFAIVGKRHDGHHFINDLYAKGVRHFIVSENIDIQPFTNANFIKVEDCLRALQQLATHHRRQFPNLQVIGITGSNGKTMVKEWLFQLLQPDHHIVRSPKSYNSQIGVALSVWQIKPEHNLAIFEAGISEKGEMEHLQPMIDPTIGVFTMLGMAHSEGFASPKEKTMEKFKLFKNAKHIIYSVEARRTAHIAEETALLRVKGLQMRERLMVAENILTGWTRNLKLPADLHVNSIQNVGNKTVLKAIFRNQAIETTIPFTDHASIENAISCWMTLLQMGYAPTVIAERMARLEAVAMRLELKAGVNNCLVINDSYNSDLTSLNIALDFMVQQGAGRATKTLIMSDILQSGQDLESLYRKVAEMLCEKKITRVIGIGSDIILMQHWIDPTCVRAEFYATTPEFLKKIQNRSFQNEVILLKGARIFEFEHIADRLAQKTHKTVLEVNLNALSHNLLIFKKLLEPSVKIMVMVKASAYGNGSHEVGRLLEYHKTDYLAVAYADEGIDLRKAGIKLPMMVLNPEPASFEAMARYDLEPEIYSLRLLKQFIGFADKNETQKIHLKFDTGMHRLGFSPSDLPELMCILKNNPQIQVQSAFSHLAASENPQFDAFTQSQFKQFTEMYETLTKDWGVKPLRHILNSSGIVRFPEAHLDMVRLGIGLYGIDGSETIQKKLQCVQTLKATISQIKIIPAGDTIGYSRRGVAVNSMRIATISIGYADGLLRGAGNSKFAVWLHGKRAFIVGGVCMDMCMLDITQIPEAKEGDEVEIFGANVSVNELAKVLDTIPYEVFTNVSERVKRVYFQE